MRAALLTAVAMAGLVGGRLRRSVDEERHDGRDRDADDDDRGFAFDLDDAPRGASTADVVARVLPGVVNVRTVGFNGNQGEGSGVVIDRRGVILTNNHVIRGARKVTVSFNDGRHKRPSRARSSARLRDATWRSSAWRSPT